MRRAPLLALALACLAALALAACGGGSEEGSGQAGAESSRADAEVLNRVLTRQLAAVEAYGEVLPGLGGRDRALASAFRGHEQEHVDALLKVLRGLGGSEERGEEAIEAGGLETRADRLRFLYALESATIDAEIKALTELTSAAARSLLATTLANQAEHLVLLRRALGAPPLRAVPAPFETGTVPVP